MLADVKIKQGEPGGTGGEYAVPAASVRSKHETQSPAIGKRLPKSGWIIRLCAAQN